jgi:PAS domain S-box-containing protein
MNETLLLADDEEGIRTVLGIALADQGFDVLTAADGREALELFRRAQPAIVLTDIKMPGIDGIELLRRIKRERPETEVIMITGHGDMELAIESLKLEAVDFVTKPIHDDILGIALKRARERIAMRRELRAYTENLEQLVQKQAARIVEIERLAAVGQAIEGIAAAFRGMASAGAEEGLRVLNELPCLVAVHDPELRVVSINALGRERLGELVGRRSWEIYARRDEPGYQCPAARTLATGAPQRLKEEVVFRDGRRAVLMVHTAPIRNRGGEAELVLEIAVDLSEVERLRRELAEAQGRLAALGLMLGSVAHGVKGILTGMDAGLYLARSGLRQADAARAAEGIETLADMVERIRRIALNVLDFAKERPVERRAVAAGAFARAVAELAAAKAAAHGIALEADVPAGLGEFEADEAAVQAALLNILENAVDACRQDAAKAAHTIRFAVRAEAEAVVFTVADNGVGIPPEYRERIFDLFESSKGREGTGLGLFISRQVAHQHGGAIAVASTPGEGSTFRVRLPRRPPAASAPPA